MKNRMFTAILVLSAFAAGFGQTPASITLRAKLRDFKEFPFGAAGTHPDFENQAFNACGGMNYGYVRATIDTNNLGSDSLQFYGDNRGPVLIKLGRTSGTLNIPCYTSFDYFSDWYNDFPSNDRDPLSRRFYTDLVLTRDAAGLYTYNDDTFFPLDDGEPYRKFLPTDPNPYGMRTNIETHNYGFTMELHTYFTYRAGTGQIFTFKGDDDVWVFINDKLTIDLGGLHNYLTQTVNLDAQAAALGLVNGRNYPLDFFFAERMSYGSHCQITTSLALFQTPILPTPVATPPGGPFKDSVTVSLEVPGHPAAQIRYTVDGTDPGPTSPLYTGPLTFKDNTTLKAIGYEVGYTPSNIMTEVYGKQIEKLPMPVANPPGPAPGLSFKDSLQVSLSVPGHPAAVIRYTLDGSAPNANSPIYAGPLTLKSNTTIKAMAFEPGWTPSDISTNIYVKELDLLPVPVADPPGKAFPYQISVSLSVPGHPDAEIRYTVDGTEPGPGSPVYNGPLVFDATTTLKAKAFKPGFLPSGVMTEVYTLQPPPNVISIRMDSTFKKTVPGTPAIIYPAGIRNQPIGVISADPGGNPVCLICAPGTGGIFLGNGPHPEWIVSSKDPFQYTWTIYDHVGQFVTQGTGTVDAALMAQVPGDAEGYRTLRFRWVPVAGNNRLIGTGAYILRGKVTSFPANSQSGRGRAESSILKTFGYLRRD